MVEIPKPSSVLLVFWDHPPKKLVTTERMITSGWWNIFWFRKIWKDCVTFFQDGLCDACFEMPRNNGNNKKNGFRSLDMTISPRFWPGLPEQVSLDDTSSLFAAVKSTKGKWLHGWPFFEEPKKWSPGRGDAEMNGLTTWTKDLDFSLPMISFWTVWFRFWQLPSWLRMFAFKTSCDFQWKKHPFFVVCDGLWDLNRFLGNNLGFSTFPYELGE